MTDKIKELKKIRADAESICTRMYGLYKQALDNIQAEDNKIIYDVYFEGDIEDFLYEVNKAVDALEALIDEPEVVSDYDEHSVFNHAQLRLK